MTQPLSASTREIADLVDRTASVARRQQPDRGRIFGGCTHSRLDRWCDRQSRGAAITRHGAVLVAAGAPSFTEGQLPYHRLVVFRWPSRRGLEGFIGSDEYAHTRALRVGAVNWVAAVVPALEPEAGK